MNDCVVIMHAREAAPCMEAFRQLDTPKIWLDGFTESEIVAAWPRVLGHGFDWYWVVSDDAIVRQPVLEELRALRDAGLQDSVVTGYSQRSHTEWVTNVTKGPLTGDSPVPGTYDFADFSEVVSHPDRAIRTWLGGMSLTGMSHDNWRLFPFGCFGSDAGYASDLHLSLRLQAAGVPIFAGREAFCYHWRHEWQHTNHPQDDRLLVGKMQRRIRLEP